MGLKIRIAILLSGAAALLQSCNTGGCTDNQNALPLAGFYDASTLQAITLTGLSIGGVGAPGDSLLVSPRDRVSQVYLPFRSTELTTSFFIGYEAPGDPESEEQPATPVPDRLTFTYDATPFLSSEECGASFQYRITSLEYTRHSIDSVAIVDSLITNVNRETLKIFFRTTAEKEGGDR